MFERYGRIHKGHYVKRVSARHYMIKYQGFGVSCSVLGELVDKGVPYVLHIYLKTNGDEKYLLTSVKKFLESDKEFTFDKDDRQKFVSEKDMIEINPEEYFGGK